MIKPNAMQIMAYQTAFNTKGMKRATIDSEASRAAEPRMMTCTS
jgi:hypothetical protein